MSKKTPITVAHGGGIGPEIMEAFDGKPGFTLAQGQ
jgi:hypothetical protein